MSEPEAMRDAPAPDRAEAGAAVLVASGLCKSFGAVRASDDVSLALHPGEVHALIGPNGAGKSTLVAQIAGSLRPDAGSVHLHGRDVTALGVAARARLGLGRGFQVSAVVSDYSVLENVALAVRGRRGDVLRSLRRWSGDRTTLERARAAATRVGLRDRMDVPAAELSHGERRRLELATTLALEPRAFLLDEPMAGLGAEGAAAMTALIGELAGVAPVLLVEHDMDVVFALADRITVLVDGRVLASGDVAAIRSDARVREAYLGEDEAGVTDEAGPAGEAGPTDGAGEEAGRTRTSGRTAARATGRATERTGAALELRGVTARYGASLALHGVDLSIEPGETLALLGRNGMGKTTTIRTICRLLPHRDGSITLDGRAIDGLSAHRVARLGIGLVPEGRRVFADLSVFENLSAAARPGAWDVTRVTALFPRLGERRRQRAGTLSGGEQQMLAIGRALMTNPRLLVLDEATEGLAPIARAEIRRAIGRLREEGSLSILIVDSSLAELRRVADRAVVLERGRSVWEGPMRALDEGVSRRWLGV